MLEVRLAERDDAPHIGVLIDAMDQHYRGADAARSPDAAVAMIAQTLDVAEGTRFMLAFDGKMPVGIACFAIIRPGRALAGLIFLKDLFVVETARGHGIGRRLMAALAEFAVSNGIGRIDLTTDHDNTGAQTLYAELGGTARPKLLYTFDGEALSRLAKA